ncbi:lytic transglycosylase domain-containing protein [Luteimonas sp. SX5]|uniref:Lytic transglycosylase domain-containing protein n=1 Tax=Luteimonas galliterrae TaxID=2940486 RepID=A0ABT0MLS4_9GAMM|nr:lytic transglycosylase domain-containing protein [Luteimonas galliterrae]MCL1635149.1 lytic transglycosylase domain-containing protein [Luteimonas galliterrae]
MKGVRGLLLFVCVLAAAPAVAGTVYRCETADGARSYVSKRIPHARCTPISYAGGGSTRVKKDPAIASWLPPKAAVGSATGPAVVAGSPASGVAPALTASTVPATAATPAARSPQFNSGTRYCYRSNGVLNCGPGRPRGVPLASIRKITYSFMETCFACGAKPGVNFGTLRLNTAAYQQEIANAAREFGVEEAIVRAIIHAESAFNPNALSRVGAQGLMQLMPATARRFGVGNAFDAGQNIRGGVQYLAWLLKRFNGDLTLAAAGYNAGEGAVDKYRGVPPYSETQRYVQRVGVLAERYRGGVAKQ